MGGTAGFYTIACRNRPVDSLTALPMRSLQTIMIQHSIAWLSAVCVFVLGLS
jgi:hypothetical protein